MIAKIKKIMLALLALTVVGGAVAGVIAVKIHYGNHKVPAEANALEYAEALGYDVRGVSCTNLDTDGDSYVSCDVVLKDGTKQSLQCVGAVPFWHLTGNDGCKDVVKFQNTMSQGR
jgi:hypothetical protein